ncbi:MAG: hypothetical protein JNN32_12085 [Flavobacteriales bacterium]|nr:hypothetical protein [Flavobacteriales bacterium]
MDLTGSESLDALVALVTANNADRIIVTKAALHGFLERFRRGELSRMDLFEIAEFLQLAAHAVPEPRYESAIEAILEKLAHYPLEEDAPLSTSRLQYELDQYRPVAPILGFEDMATLRSTLGHPEQPTAHVTRKACTIWLERLGDGDLTTDELVAMAQHLLGHEPVDAEPGVREFLVELVEPGLSKEAMLGMGKKLERS